MLMLALFVLVVGVYLPFAESAGGGGGIELGLEQSRDFRLRIFVLSLIKTIGGEDDDNGDVTVSLLSTSRPSSGICASQLPSSSCTRSSTTASSPSDDALDWDNRVLSVTNVDTLDEELGCVECLLLAATACLDPAEVGGCAGATDSSPSPAAMNLLTPCTPSFIPSSTAPPCSCAAAVPVKDVDEEFAEGGG
jgi:hypothetical protein